MVDVWTNAANCLSLQGDDIDAEQCYQQALDSEEKNLDTYLNASTTYIKLFEKLDDEQYLLKAKKLLLDALDEYDNQQIHIVLGRIYLLLGKEEEACKEFEPFEITQTDESTSVYDLLPNNDLCKVYDEIKDFKLSEARLAILREIYGDRSEDELKALELREAYFRVFDEPQWKNLKTDADKWCAVLYFFIRGINKKSEDELKKIAEDGIIEVREMPPFTRLMAARIREMFKKQEMSNSIIKFDIMKIRRIDEAIKAILLTEVDEDAKLLALEDLEKAMLIKKQGNEIIMRHPLLKQAVGDHIKYDEFGKNTLRKIKALLEKIKLQEVMNMVKKIKLLYGNYAEDEVKKCLRKLNLSEKEKEKVLDEV